MITIEQIKKAGDLIDEHEEIAGQMEEIALAMGITVQLENDEEFVEHEFSFLESIRRLLIDACRKRLSEIRAELAAMGVETPAEVA